MSDSSAAATDAPKPSFLRQWGVLIAFGVLAVGTLVGFRTWTEAKAQAPVTREYAGFLDYMAERSPQAREYRQTYYRKFARDTVASQHFEQVCAVMHRVALDEGAEPGKYSEHMSRGCEQLARIYIGTELPD